MTASSTGVTLNDNSSPATSSCVSAHCLKDLSRRSGFRIIPMFTITIHVNVGNTATHGSHPVAV